MRKLLTKRDRQRLRAARLAKEWTQFDLAAHLDVSNVHICVVEAGKEQPSLDLLDRWCRALELKLVISVEEAGRRAE